MERRKSPRAAMNQEVIGRIPATPIRAKILDLSGSGCQIESESPLVLVGRTILLDLSDTCELAGTVVRKSGDHAGIEFTEPINPEILSRLLTPDGKALADDSVLRDSFGRHLPPLGANFRVI